MKRLIRYMALAAAAMPCLLTAQEPAAFDLPRQVLYSADNKLKGETIKKVNRQFRDEMDTLCKLKVTTIAYPYKTKRDKKHVATLIDAIQTAYNYHENAGVEGYVSIVDFQSTQSSQKMRIAFPKGSVEIGGERHSYAVLRQADAKNPAYRAVGAVEWWPEPFQERVCFKAVETFSASNQTFGNNAATGRNGRSVTLYRNDDGSRLSGDTLRMQLADGDSALLIAPDANDQRLNEIAVLVETYNNIATAKYRPALVRGINQRLLQGLEPGLNDAERTAYLKRLFRTLSPCPGYTVELISGEGKEATVETTTLSDLADRFDGLDVFAITFCDERDVKCRKYGDLSRNGILEVYLNH